MTKLRSLFRAVVGLSAPRTLDSRPLPSSAIGLQPVAVVHDRRLSAGVFAVPRKKSKTPLYRLIVWRTYRDAKGKESATVNLFRDEVDPAFRLMQQAVERIPMTQA